MAATAKGIISLLSSRNGEKGVPQPKKGVIKDNDDSIKPTLSAPERSRYTNIFKLFKKIVFPDEEATRLKGTNIDKVSKLDSKKDQDDTKKSGSLPLKLLAALGIMAAAALLFDYLGPVGRFLTKFITKLTSLKLLKTLKNIGSRIKNLKLFKKISDILKSVGNFFKGIGGKIAKRLKNSRIFRSITNVLNTVGDFFKGIGGKIAKRLKNTRFAKTITDAFKSIGGIGSKIAKSLKNTRFVKTITDAFKSIGGIGSKIIGWLGFGGKAGKAGGALAKGFRSAGGILKAIFGGIIGKVGAKLLKFLRFLPVIGSLVSFGFAFVRFKRGETIPAIFEILSGILNLIPAGVTQVISMAIDGGLMLYDMYTGHNKKREEAGGEKISFLQYLKDVIGKKLMAVLEYLPGIGGMVTLGKAWGEFKSGNIGEGLKLLGASIFASIGGKGLGDLALKGINWIISMFNSEGEEVQDPVVEEEKGWLDMIGEVWKKVTGIVGKVFTAVKEWVKEKLSAVGSAIADFFGIEVDDIDDIKEENKSSSPKVGPKNPAVTAINKQQLEVDTKMLTMTEHLHNAAIDQLRVLMDINKTVNQLLMKYESPKGRPVYNLAQNQNKPRSLFNIGDTFNDAFGIKPQPV